jgi:hypothetical protein
MSVQHSGVTWVHCTVNSCSTGVKRDSISNEDNTGCCWNPFCGRHHFGIRANVNSSNNINGWPSNRPLKYQSCTVCCLSMHNLRSKQAKHNFYSTVIKAKKRSIKHGVNWQCFVSVGRVARTQLKPGLEQTWAGTRSYWLYEDRALDKVTNTSSKKQLHNTKWYQLL